ncbi:hypothetical protein AB0383_20055 [Amycolatopsis sp. NPDC051373]|uniref:hypothetical protein n=1 Tax=Amycolatopsis sp. NPDC051373 TaxID=3155801 RepID=UPI00344BF237
MSIDVVQAIEGMEERQLRPGTKKKLEDGMQLEPGSIDDVLHDRGPFREQGSVDVATVEQPFDPMTASNEELGRHADFLSKSSGDPTLGPRWMVGVMQKRLNVEESHDDSAEADRHVM